MLIKAQEMGVCFHRGKVFGIKGGGRSFPKVFERREKLIFLLGEMLLRNSKEM